MRYISDARESKYNNNNHATMLLERESNVNVLCIHEVDNTASQLYLHVRYIHCVREEKLGVTGRCHISRPTLKGEIKDETSFMSR